MLRFHVSFRGCKNPGLRNLLETLVSFCATEQHFCFIFILAAVAVHVVVVNLAIPSAEGWYVSGTFGELFWMPEKIKLIGSVSSDLHVLFKWNPKYKIRSLYGEGPARSNSVPSSSKTGHFDNGWSIKHATVTLPPNPPGNLRRKLRMANPAVSDSAYWWFSTSSSCNLCWKIPKKDPQGKNWKYSTSPEKKKKILNLLFLPTSWPSMEFLLFLELSNGKKSHAVGERPKFVGWWHRLDHHLNFQCRRYARWLRILDTQIY